MLIPYRSPSLFMFMFQINNILQKHKIAKQGPAVMNSADLTKFFADNSKVPEDADTAFVLDYLITDVEKEPNLQQYNENEFKFVGLLTTKRLLSHCLGTKVKIVHADTTYKLLWEDFPVHVFGTTDYKKSFHLVGIGISTNETAETYEFCFNAIHKGVLEIHENDFEWLALMSDASRAIKKGFEQVHPFGLKRTCYFHMKKAITKRSFTSPVNKTLAIENVSRLNLCADVKMFDKAVELFNAKWIDKEEAFVDYMKKYWFNNENKYFFGGAMAFTPSTNNALESTNRKIKTGFRFLQRYKMSEFKEKVMDMINTFSTEYKTGLKKVVWTVPISDDAWKGGIRFVDSKKEIIKEKETGSNITYNYIPSGDDLKINPDDLETYKAKSWETFDSFYTNMAAIWVVKIADDNINTATCTCPNFMRQYVCKHILGVGLRAKIVPHPPHLRQLSKRPTRRGRPKKTGPALSFE